MSRLLGEQKAVIITTLDGCMDPLLPLEVLKKYVMTIGVGSVLETEAMKLRLVQMGYERVGQVEMPGPVSYTHLDVYKRQVQLCAERNTGHLLSSGRHGTAFRAGEGGTHRRQ